MWFHELIARYRRWQSIRETIAALECLPTTELDDLGFGRWRIPDIAESHAGYQRGASGPRPATNALSDPASTCTASYDHPVRPSAR